MNFKTTIILLALLIIVGGVIYFTKNSAEKPSQPTETKLLDIVSTDVTGVTFVGDDGTISLTRSNGKWNLTQPVQAPADDGNADGLVDALTTLKSRDRVAADASTGLDQPKFKVAITTKDNKTIKLDVGNRSAAGDNLYVKLDGQTQADVVPAEVYDALSKPLKEWRKPQLLDVASPNIKQIKVATTQQSFAIEQRGEDWKMTEPQKEPVEMSEASDMGLAIAGLQAVDFVSEKSEDAKRYGLENPVMTVSFSTQAPTTQPTTQPNFTTIKFGRFDDIMKQNVYAMISSQPGIVKVAASTLDKFKKSPIDLRDKRVVNADPDHITKLTIVTDKPAVAPKVATHETVVLQRAKQVVTTAPATMPATTQAATQPVEPPSKWSVASANNANADDPKVEELLSALHPLRADKYLQTPPPTTQPAANVTITIESTDATQTIELTDPGNSQPLIGRYNGLTFEVERTLLEKLSADFVKKPLGPLK